MQPRLLPDGTPDVHYRTARGGQKLRDIMLEGYIDLYGPYVSRRRRRCRSRLLTVLAPAQTDWFSLLLSVAAG